MYAYVLTVVVVDFDRVEGSEGPGAIARYMENVRYPNRCVSPEVVSTVGYDIGPWCGPGGEEEDPDGHPLNFTATDKLAWLAENAARVAPGTAKAEWDTEVAEERRQRAQQETEKERAEYERLRAKYG